MRKPRRPDGTAADYSKRALRLLEMGGLVKSARGWRFGTTRIRQDMVDRLVASGDAVIQGNRCIPARAVEARP